VSQERVVVKLDKKHGEGIIGQSYGRVKLSKKVYWGVKLDGNDVGVQIAQKACGDRMGCKSVLGGSNWPQMWVSQECGGNPQECVPLKRSFFIFRPPLDDACFDCAFLLFF